MCRGIEITSGFIGDYVFEEDYQRLSIPNLKKYFNENKHMPGMKSAVEIYSNGNKYDLGERTENLVVKVEESYLYLIELSEAIEALKKENEALKKEIASMK